MSSDLRDTLVRIDERTKNMKESLDERFDNLDKKLFGSGGHEERIRSVEQDNAATKAKAGLIATGISLLIGALGFFLKK